MEHTREYEILVNRSKGFLKIAEYALNNGLHDLACFSAEQAVQLHIKAQLLKLIGDYPRTHHIRLLIARLLEVLPARKKSTLQKYVKINRARLSELEDAYTMARYTTKTYTQEDAEEIVDFAKEVINKVEEIVG